MVCLFQVKELEEALQMEQLRPATPRGLEQAQKKDTSFEVLQVGLHANNATFSCVSSRCYGALCRLTTSPYPYYPIHILPFPSFLPFSPFSLSSFQHKFLQAEEGRRAALKDVSRLKDEMDDLKVLIRYVICLWCCLCLLACAN